MFRPVHGFVNGFPFGHMLSSVPGVNVEHGFSRHETICWELNMMHDEKFPKILSRNLHIAVFLPIHKSFYRVFTIRRLSLKLPIVAIWYWSLSHIEISWLHYDCWEKSAPFSRNYRCLASFEWETSKSKTAKCGLRKMGEKTNESRIRFWSVISRDEMLKTLRRPEREFQGAAFELSSYIQRMKWQKEERHHIKWRPWLMQTAAQLNRY